jgi:hypothetical protein
MEGSMKFTKKTKGWSVILAAFLLVVFGAGTAFAYPYIETAVSPKTQVLMSLKTIETDCQEQMEENFDILNALLTDKTTFSGAVSQAEFDSYDLIQYYGYDGENISVQTDAGERTADINVNSTDRKITFEELLKKCGGQDYQKFLDAVDNDTMLEYMDMLKKAANHSDAFFSTVLDKSLYEKNGKETLDIDGSQIFTTMYTVTITKEALLSGVEAFLDAVYDDTELSAYMTMFATFTGESKNSLNEKVQELFADFTYVTVRVAIDKQKNIVELATEFDTDFAYVTVTAKGQNSWNETVIYTANTQRSEMTVYEKNDGEKTDYDISAQYHKNIENEYSFLNVKLQKENNTLTAKDGEVFVQYDGHTAKGAFEGKAVWNLEN